MTDEKPGGTYSVHLTGPLAEEIERDAERRGVSKSKAMRALLEDGKTHRSDLFSFFERASLQAVSVLLSAAVAVVVSLAVVVLASLSGYAFGIPRRHLLELGGITMLVLVLSAVVTWALYRCGISERIDELANTVARWLGVDS